MAIKKSKTRRAALKRYKRTANGNLLRRKSYKGHLLQKKNSSRKRRLLASVTVNTKEMNTVKKFFNK